MPKKLLRCVRKVKKTVKPRKGRTKTQSAWAICQKSTGLKPHKSKRKPKVKKRKKK